MAEDAGGNRKSAGVVPRGGLVAPMEFRYSSSHSMIELRAGLWEITA